MERQMMNKEMIQGKMIKKTMIKKGILMSMFMGAIMGLVFTIFAQLKNQGQIMPVGIVISIFISIVISLIIGLIIPVRNVNVWICKLFRITPDKKIAVNIASAFAFDIIFTPLNCIVNMWYGMAMSLKELPPNVETIFDKMKFCLGLDHFVPALISTLLIDLVIGFFLTFFVTPYINKITDKICGIESKK